MPAATARQCFKKTEWPHITLNQVGVPCIDGTRFKVQVIVIDYTLNGMSADQIQAAYPILTRAQVHAALAYYFDNKPAMDLKLESDREFVVSARLENPNTLTREQLVARLTKARSSGDSASSLRLQRQ